MNDSRNPSKSPKDAEGVLWTLPRIALIVAVVLVIAYAVAFHAKPLYTDPAAWGQFGDYMGGLLNPLISLFTLIVAVSVWSLQKTELLETRKAVKEQGKTAEQQRQEQRFFDLLNVYHRTVDSITFVQWLTNGPAREQVFTSGKNAIGSWLKYSTLDQKALKGSEALVREAIAPQYGRVDSVGFYDHYFRVVFRLLSEAEALLGDQHFRYVKLFRAQLSRPELIILSYNIWLDDEGKKAIPIAVKYGLLKHLPASPLRSALERDLPPYVFGRNHAQICDARKPEAHPSGND